MKKSLFAVALAVILLATNCQKTEIMNPTGTSIGFDSQIGKLTKAADSAGLDSLRKYGFRVWAYRNYEDEFYAGTDATTYPKGKNAIYDAMEALKVTYTAEKWTTSKDYYWPGAKKELKFFAVSCNETDFSLESASDNGTTSVVTNPTEDLVQVTDFSVKKTADNDLMVADLITQAQGDATNGNVVKPVFRHTLTKVQFNFNTDPETVNDHPVYILGIQTSELATSGTFSRKYPYSQTTGDADEWKLGKATSQFVDNNETAITLHTDGQETEITVDGEGNNKDRTGLTLDATMQTLDTWLLLPQEISTATVEVTYIIKNRLFTKTFPLYADGLTKWDVNQFVKYNVTIAPNLISFNPTVEEWDTTDVTMNDNGTQVAPNTPDPEQPVTPTYSHEVKDNNGTTLFTYQNATEGDDTYPAIGDEATPNGTHVMTDGTTVVVEDGKITSVTEGTGTNS